MLHACLSRSQKPASLTSDEGKRWNYTKKINGGVSNQSIGLVSWGNFTSAMTHPDVLKEATDIDNKDHKVVHSSGQIPATPQSQRSEGLRCIAGWLQYAFVVSRLTRLFRTFVPEDLQNRQLNGHVGRDSRIEDDADKPHTSQLDHDQKSVQRVIDDGVVVYSIPSSQSSPSLSSDSASESAPSSEVAVSAPTWRLYRIRWFIVFLFASYSGTNGYQWIHLVIIGDKIAIYYNESLPRSDFNRNYAIDFLSLIYMVVYIPFIFPATWMLDKGGLRLTAIVGSLLNAIGAWMKCASVSPDRVWVLFFAQAICSIAQVFILGIPARLAAIWFGINEVSTATAIGVFGNQIGSALGFVIPPAIVTQSDIDGIGHGLSIMMYGGAAIMTFLFILVVIFFRNSPPLPPSEAQLAAAKMWSNEDYLGSLRRLLTNWKFVLLLITYGLNTGSFYEIGTLLNPIVLYYFPGATADAGNIGLTMCLVGIVAIIVAGIILDKTKQFKLTTLILYIMCLLSMVAFTFTLSVNRIWVIYITGGLLGFFLSAYLAIGYEFGAELTFPESEGTSSGLLNASAQLFGIALTLGVRAIMQLPNGMLPGNITTCAALLLGTIGTGFIKSDLRRQAAQQHKLSLEGVDNAAAVDLEEPPCETQNHIYYIDGQELTLKADGDVSASATDTTITHL